MKNSSLRSQSGFSLVELMVVVAIIGVLAAMSAGQVQKQIAKSRQSEVKTNLATLWSANESFKAEWAAYTGDFGMMKLGYTGNLRYDVGFAGVGPVVPGYTGGSNTFASAGTYCPSAAANGDCQVINSNGVAPVAPANTPTATAYTASGAAAIYTAATQDVWTMTNQKTLANLTPGIP